MRNAVVRIGAAACLLLCVQGTAMATPSGASAYIESVGQQALSTISSKELPQEQKQATLEKLFKENLDFDWVGKFVMGRFWREATDDQKSRYIAAYKNFLTKHYTARFSEYTSGSFKVTGAKETGKDESLVSMEIISSQKNEPPILIDYKVRKTGSSYKVFDIIVEGVSLITTQRSEFSSVINKNGIDGLIQQLTVK